MSAMDAFWAAPPITRTLTAATVVISVSVYMGLLDPYRIVFLRQSVFKLWMPHLWRLVTSFMLTGPKLALLMDPYFLYTYGAALETGSARFSQTADFLVFILFTCSVIVLTSGVYLNGVVFLPAFTTALAYLYAQQNPEALMTFYIVTFKVKYMPYCMLLMTMITASPMAALHQGTGIVAAHLYDFLTRVWPTFGGGSNLVPTPQFLQRLFAPGPGEGAAKSYGTAFQARPSTGATQAAAQPSRGWTSGFGSNSWGNNGPGRRLG